MQTKDIEVGTIYAVELYGGGTRYPMLATKTGKFEERVYSDRSFRGHMATKNGAAMQELNTNTLEPSQRRVVTPGKTVEQMGVKVKLTEDTEVTVDVPAQWIESRKIVCTWAEHSEAAAKANERRRHADEAYDDIERELSEYDVSVHINRTSYSQHHPTGYALVSASSLRKLVEALKEARS